MKTPPNLSIVLVAINNLEITKRCLSSLREFTETPYEIIIIDNASSETEATEYYRNNSDKFYRIDEIVSLSKAWNKGIELSEGKYVAVINNDTVVSPNWDNLLLETLKKNPNAGMVSPITLWLLRGHFNYGMFPHFKEDKGTERIHKLEKFKELVWGEFCVFTRKALEEIGGYNPIYERAGSEDLEILFQLYKHGYDVYLDARSFIYHQGNASRKPEILSFEDAKRYEDKNFKLFKSRWPEYTKDWD
jgi:GT2 family glycosyltransferase